MWWFFGTDRLREPGDMSAKNVRMYSRIVVMDVPDVWGY